MFSLGRRFETLLPPMRYAAGQLPRRPAFVVKKAEEKSEWSIVDGEMHEIGDHISLRERFVIPRENLPNRRRKQLREQFMRCTRLVLKEAEHEAWCRRYMELYQGLRENWKRLYWNEGYSKKLAKDHANYDSAEKDDKDFSSYRSRQFNPRQNQYHEELLTSEIKVSKQLFVDAIKAYSKCENFEKVKQVLLDERISLKNLNELKSSFVDALISFGTGDDPLTAYIKLKHVSSDLEPEVIINLIEYLQTYGELSMMLELLDELRDLPEWINGCCRLILYCILQKRLSSAIDLLRQYNDNFCKYDFASGTLYDEIFSIVDDMGPTYLEDGLELLRIIKCEFGQSPTRKSLDFLQSACINAKDLDKALLILKEYKLVGLPYNEMTNMRMYEALLAGGDYKSAKIWLHEILKEDNDFRILIQQYKVVYLQGNKEKKTAKTLK